VAVFSGRQAKYSLIVTILENGFRQRVLRFVGVFVGLMGGAEQIHLDDDIPTPSNKTRWTDGAD
jgi:hypothetical protein